MTVTITNCYTHRRMNWRWNAYLPPLIVAALVMTGIAVYAWRRRFNPGARLFAVLMLCASVWAWGYAAQLGGLDVPTQRLWSNLKYFGIVSSPVAWVIFALQYVGLEKHVTRRHVALLCLLPTITMILAWTDEWHGLVSRNWRMDFSGVIPIVRMDFGFWYWVHAFSAYALVVVGVILLLRAARDRKFYRSQAVALTIGALAPVIGSLLFITGLGPIPGLDVAPFGFMVTGVAFTWALFRYRTLDLAPIANDEVVRNLGDAVFVLDLRDRIVDVNPAAERVTGRTESALVGQTIGVVLFNTPPP